MQRDDLIVDIQEIPLKRDVIEENLQRLLEHARYLEEINDVEDPLAKGLLDAAPSFIRNGSSPLSFCVRYCGKCS